MRGLVERSRQRVKQTFVQLELRVFRPDKKTLILESEVRGRERELVKKRPTQPVTSEDEEIREEYMSRLTH